MVINLDGTEVSPTRISWLTAEQERQIFDYECGLSQDASSGDIILGVDHQDPERFHAIWDFPGQLDYFDPDYDDVEIFTGVGALIWVIDAQDEYEESCSRLVTTILNVRPLYPDMHIEVFVHKIDALNAELKADVLNDIQQLVEDSLNDQEYADVPVNYYLTSIYDHSIFEALSKVMQKLIGQLPTFENLLNILVNSCGMEKAYLFDTQTKTYIGSDTRPIDMEVYELCSDFIDVIVDTSELFGWVREDENGKGLGPQMDEVESTVTVHNDTMIYLKEMNRYLCLVTVIKNPAAKDKKGLIDYNCHIFQDALGDVFAKGWEKKEAEGNASLYEQGESAADDSRARLQLAEQL
ncbi:putative gtp-binding protein gtr2 [Phaeomoniella chlamydospora]|uniref:GTP-binding protein n=1 Tax=Phaeomoniella chlamydospora TaxID=158046 RepID=A0A0G2HHQ2_PHACM|nr:putative gtp-binding protein gtr2 [Phaeomoniella chlamydospora]